MRGAEGGKERRIEVEKEGGSDGGMTRETEGQ